MKKSLVSLLTVGVLVAPSALVFAEGTGAEEGVPTTSIEVDTIVQERIEAFTEIETLDISEEQKLMYMNKISTRNTTAGINEWLIYARDESARNNAKAEPKITTGIVTETESIEPETIYEDDPELLVGLTRTENGTPGERTITYEVTYSDGVEIDRQVTSSDITIDAVATVVYTGTKAPELTPAEPIKESNNETESEEFALEVVKKDYESKIAAYNKVRYDVIDLNNGNVGIIVLHIEDANTATPVLFLEYNTDSQTTGEVEADYISEHRLATLSEVKESATADLSDLDLLPEEDVDAFALRIKEASTREEVQLILAEAIEANEDLKEPILYSREDLLGRDDDLITFDTEDEAQGAIDALDEEDQEGLEVAETEDGLFYIAHVISATPIEPIKPIEDEDGNFYVNVVKNDFPQYDEEGYSYEVETLDDFVFITITDADGEFVAEIEYNIADQTTRIVSVALTPLEPAKPIEKDEETTEEETTEEDSEETTEEETTTVEVVTDNGATPVQVIRSTSTESSRAELPETGELGGGLTVLAGALSALGGLGLLFKKRK